MDFRSSPSVFYIDDDHDDDRQEYFDGSRNFSHQMSTSYEMISRAEKKRKLTNQHQPNTMLVPQGQGPKRPRNHPFDQGRLERSHSIQSGTESEPILLDPEEYVIEQPETPHSFHAFDWTLDQRRLPTTINSGPPRTVPLIPLLPPPVPPMQTLNMMDLRTTPNLSRNSIERNELRRRSSPMEQTLAQQQQQQQQAAQLAAAVKQQQQQQQSLIGGIPAGYALVRTANGGLALLAQGPQAGAAAAAAIPAQTAVQQQFIALNAAGQPTGAAGRLPMAMVGGQPQQIVYQYGGQPGLQAAPAQYIQLPANYGQQAGGIGNAILSANGAATVAGSTGLFHFVSFIIDNEFSSSLCKSSTISIFSNIANTKYSDRSRSSNECFICCSIIISLIDSSSSCNSINLTSKTKCSNSNSRCNSTTTTISICICTTATTTSSNEWNNWS